jgi:Fe-S cluster assembly protein SufD
MNLLETFSHFNQKFPVTDIWTMRRQTAVQALEKNGWPTRKNESWKYTNLQSFKALTFVTTDSSPNKFAEEELLPGCYHIVFNDGILKTKEFSIPGVQVIELREALQTKSGPWTKWMGRWEAELAKLKTGKDFTEQLSEAFLDSGVCLQVHPNTKLDKPVQIAFLNSGKAQGNFSSTQIWVDLGKSSQSDLILTSQGNEMQVNQTQIWAHENSHTRFMKFGDLPLENSDFQRIEVQIEAQAEFHSWSVGMGGRLQRNEFEVFLKGAGITGNFWGVSLSQGATVIDHHTLIDHVHGGSQTQQLYKGILSDDSRIVFDGQVKIRKGSDKASSQQLNKNLILGGTAEVDSKPQLQVLADDVKATHGSATGQMSADELFYFQSRGISEMDSRRLLAMGFVDDLIDLYPVEVVRKTIKSRMKNAFEQSWEKLK